MCIRLIIVESMEHLVAKLRHMRTMNIEHRQQGHCSSTIGWKLLKGAFLFFTTFMLKQFKLWKPLSKVLLSKLSFINYLSSLWIVRSFFNSKFGRWKVVAWYIKGNRTERNFYSYYEQHTPPRTTRISGQKS